MKATLGLTVLMFSLCGFAAEPSQLVKNLQAGKKQHLVTYGTSLTAGGAWVGQVKELLTKKYGALITVTNSAKSGMWSKWGVDNLEKQVLNKNPDTVIIEFAINDAFAKYASSLDDAKKNLETMIERILKQSASCEIILMTMNPPINDHLERRPGMEKYYQMYRDVAAERKLRLIDHYPNWKAILDKDKATFDAYVPDGIHPNAKGAHAVILPAMETALFGK